MNYRNHSKVIFILFFTFLIKSALGGYIPCALNTDCKLIYYTDYITIPTPEKADYKCHLKQEINTGTPGIVSEVMVSGSHIVDRVELGKGSTGKGVYEANVYIPLKSLSKRKLLDFSVKRDIYKSSACLIFLVCPREPVNPTITVNCTKLN
jgi:hypothetical protein